MATSFSTMSVTVKAQLNNGTSATGQVKILNVPVGGSSQKIDMPKYTANLATSREAIANIMNALAPIFSKSVYRVVETTEGAITAE